MLPFVVWLAVYTLAFYSLGHVVGLWRNRIWFKVLFFPGILISVGLQKLAGILCIGGAKCETALLGDGSPPFAVSSSRVPFFAWALFVFLSHLLLYTVFIVVAIRLDQAGLIDAYSVRLPSLHAYDMIEGYFQVDARDYLSDLSDLRGNARERPWIALTLLYLTTGCFAAVTLTGKQCRWTLTFLVLLGTASYISDWFGTGFPFLTRGWWAGFSFFPRCWSLFSLYITLLLLTFLIFAACRVVVSAATALRSEGEG